MKYIILLGVLFSVMVKAEDSCENVLSKSDQTEEVKTDVNTPVPKALEGAKIIVKMKDGSEKVMDISKFKVVPRKQQLKVTHTKTMEKLVCQAEPRVVEKIVEVDSKDKNTLLVGVRKDHQDLEKEVSSDENGSYASVKSKKGAVLDVGLLRKKVFGDVGIGLGVDTNGTVKGILGVDF